MQTIFISLFEGWEHKMSGIFPVRLSWHVFKSSMRMQMSSNVDINVLSLSCFWQVPPAGKGSLYIRPLLIGTGPILGLAPSPEYTFIIYVSPVGAYFKVSNLKLVTSVFGYFLNSWKDYVKLSEANILCIIISNVPTVHAGILFLLSNPASIALPVFLLCNSCNSYHLLTFVSHTSCFSQTTICFVPFVTGCIISNRSESGNLF